MSSLLSSLPWLLISLIASEIFATENNDVDTIPKISCSSATLLVDKILNQLNDTSSTDTKVAFSKTIIYIGALTQNCEEVDLRMSEADAIIKQPASISSLQPLDGTYKLCGTGPCTVVTEEQKPTSVTGMEPQDFDIKMKKFSDNVKKFDRSVQQFNSNQRLNQMSRGAAPVQ